MKNKSPSGLIRCCCCFFFSGGRGMSVAFFSNPARAILSNFVELSQKLARFTCTILNGDDSSVRHKKRERKKKNNAMTKYYYYYYYTTWLVCVNKKLK